MSVDAASLTLFGDSLVSDESRPAALLPDTPDGPRRRALLLRAESLLRALAIIDESHPDEPDERERTDPATRRLEAKVDLLVSLVGALMQRDQPADPVRSLRWSARGVAVELPMEEPALAAPGAGALLRLQPSDALPESLLLPVVVLAVEPSPAGRRLWLQFDRLPASLDALIERHLFRMHRRSVAERRRQRAPDRDA